MQGFSQSFSLCLQVSSLDCIHEVRAPLPCNCSQAAFHICVVPPQQERLSSAVSEALHGAEYNVVLATSWLGTAAASSTSCGTRVLQAILKCPTTTSPSGNRAQYKLVAKRTRSGATCIGRRRGQTLSIIWSRLNVNGLVSWHLG